MNKPKPVLFYLKQLKQEKISQEACLEKIESLVKYYEKKIEEVTALKDGDPVFASFLKVSNQLLLSVALEGKEFLQDKDNGHLENIGLILDKAVTLAETAKNYCEKHNLDYFKGHLKSFIKDIKQDLINIKDMKTGSAILSVNLDLD